MTGEDEERLNAESGLLDPANAYANSDVPAPYATIPSWLRRCVFQVLSPREFTVLVYTYMCENRWGISFALTEQVMSDLGIRKRETISQALESLIEKGFLLHRWTRVELARAIVKRHVYQRPATEHTLLRLLEQGLIDGSLYPTNDKGGSRAFSDTSVTVGLTSLTHDRRAVLDWNEEKDGDQKQRLLEDLLRKSLNDKSRPR